MDKLLLYMNPPGDVRVGVFNVQETIWLRQQAISQLFGAGRPAITKHWKDNFECGELEEFSVVSILETTAATAGSKSRDSLLFTPFPSMPGMVALGLGDLQGLVLTSLP